MKRRPYSGYPSRLPLRPRGSGTTRKSKRLGRFECLRPDGSAGTVRGASGLAPPGNRLHQVTLLLPPVAHTDCDRPPGGGAGRLGSAFAARAGSSVLYIATSWLLMAAGSPAVAQSPPGRSPAAPAVRQPPLAALPPETYRSQAAPGSRPGPLGYQPATPGPPPGEPAGRPPPQSSDPRLETLEQAWAAALEADERLKAGHAEVASAEHSLRASQAERWPTLGIDGGYTVRSDDPAFRFRFPGLPMPSDTFPFSQSENFAFGANVNLPLYTGGRVRHGIDAAEANVASSALDLDVARADLKMAVAEAYVGVLRAQRDVAVAQSTMRSLESHVRDVGLLFQHQQVPRNDLLAAEVALSNARQNALRAANALDIRRAAYNRLLGRPLTAAVGLAERPPGLPFAGLDALTARAVGKRPEIARLAARAEALRHEAAAVRAASRPQVELRGEYAYEENRYREPEGIAAAGLGVRWTVFDAGRDRQRAAALSQKVRAVLHLKADAESAVSLEVRRAWLDVQETRQRVQVTRRAVEQAEENLRVARQQYSLGAGTNTEVLDAEVLRTQSYRNFHAATYELVLAGLRLRRSTGDL